MSSTALRIVVALAAAAVLSSCGASPATETPTGASQAAEHAAHNADDVAFAQNMIPHHQQGVELSELVPSRSANPDLLVVANHIASDQQAEILTLQGLLAQWGEPPEPHQDHGGGMTMPMAGMVDAATLNQLRSMRGEAFDELWMNSMIGHHEGAITMAETVLERGQSQDARDVARMIITAQQREIAQMKQLTSFSQ